MMFHVKQGPFQTGLPQSVKLKLDLFVKLLIKWNDRINLISPKDVALLWSRHIEDSLQLRDHMRPSAGHAIDLGSGAGFPGLVLAIATGREFHLVEADRRKAAFLREAARETAAPVIVHAVRIETLRLAPAELVTARACAPLDQLLRWAAPLLAKNGMCLFPKGRRVADELTQAAAQWHMRVEQRASATDPAATILTISEVRRVGPHAAS